MARKKRKNYRSYRVAYHRARSMTIPIAPLVGLAATPAVTYALIHATQGNYSNIPNDLAQLVGWNGSAFDAGLFAKNITPIILGCLVHKFVGGRPLNLNSILARAGVPLIRL